MRGDEAETEMVDLPKKPATYADIETAPSHLVAEIIDSRLATRSHGRILPAMARTALSVELGKITQRRTNPNALWQALPLPELHLGDDILVPEIAAWRVERLPFLPDDHVNLPPDWICELESRDDSTNRAISVKLGQYAAAGVNHAWIVDMDARRLRALGRFDRDWELLAAFDVNDQVRAPPFDAVSFSLADLWPLDRPLGMNEDPTPYYAGDR
jgi:hypothetical protein